MIAARQFLPPTHCSLLIDKGDDFPERFVHDLKSLGNEMVWFRHREGMTTRALNIYSGRRIGQVASLQLNSFLTYSIGRAISHLSIFPLNVK